jgi:hypothetical protein
MMNHGLAWWQALMPCAALLVACLGLDWGGGILARTGRTSVVAGCLCVALAWVGGVLWYRATEATDVGEPFAVAEFAAKVIPPEQDRAGQLLVQAAKEFQLEKIAVTRRLGPPEATPALREMALWWRGSDDRAKQLQDSDSFWDWRELYQFQLDEVSAGGWPDRATKLKRWVEAVGQGGWVRQLEALGNLNAQTVRGSLFDDGSSGFGGYTYEIDGQTRTGHFLDAARGMAQLLHARALCLQARGQLRPALDCYLAILTLSRHLNGRGITTDWLVGIGLQRLACQGLEGWAQAVRDEGLLLQALQGLNGQEGALSPLLDLVRSEYLSLVQLPPPTSAGPYDSTAKVKEWKKGLYRLARLAPWEHERERRFFNRAYKNLVEEAQLPTWQAAPPRNRKGPTHPVERWTLPLRTLRMSHCHCLCQLRALRMQLALAAYQVRNGVAVKSLEDLLPGLLKNLPVDPWSGKPFGYRVSRGESILTGGSEWALHWHDRLAVMDVFNWVPLPGALATPWMTVVPVVWTYGGSPRGVLIELPAGRITGIAQRMNSVREIEPHHWIAPGRGVIWSVGEDGRDDGGMDDRKDSIFLVPRLAR